MYESTRKHELEMKDRTAWFEVVESSRACTVDSDCALIFGCGHAVKASELTEIEFLTDKLFPGYLESQPFICSDAEMYAMPACVENQCVSYLQAR